MKEIEEKYDIVIIGSGMGGLACGVMLAKEGKKVCILEKNAQIGGTLQTFKRDGGKFDTGVHYVGGLEEGQPLYPYFQYLDIMKDVEIKKLDIDGYDRISFAGDDTLYPHAQGYDNFKNQLLKHFPDEEKALDNYIKDMRELCNNFGLYNIYKDNSNISELDLMYEGATQKINSYTNNKKLQQVLSGSNLLYAGEENKTPYYVHALVVNSYILSSYKFVKGGSQISRSLNYTLRDLGGTIVRNVEVTSINHDKSNVSSVTLKDGREIKADIFISNAHPTQTLEMMNKSLMRKSYVNRIMSLNNTISVFTLYIVLKPGMLKSFNYNRYHFNQWDVWNIGKYTEETWGHDLAIFGMPDPKNPECTGILSIMAYMRIEEMDPWIKTFNTTTEENERGESYDEFKEKKAQKLIESASRIIPGLKAATQSYHTSTPLTQRDYLNIVDGGLYGISRDHNAPLQSQINTKTKMKNLFFTGQNIILHGVLGATISAVVTCGEILGKQYLVDKIRKNIKT
ncbi:MAG: NAD(P)/FAD-dependent oxidoreductase [Reichenbachiella sp.]